MNNSYNYTDFVGMSVNSDDEFEPYGYPAENTQFVEDTSIEARIENMLLNHSKYYIYCE